MLSMSPAMSAGQAGGYFSREDYYLREVEQGGNSRWCGEGTASLELEGPVHEEEFRALCRGENPAGERLIAHKQTRDPETGRLIESHRAGNDCTFSAPKSVSIAYAAGVDAAKEAHDAAVVSVGRYLERHHCLYRTPEGLQHGSLVAAKFDHATSRNIDPQLHSHFFVLNAVQTPDGSWRANDPKVIYQELKSLGLMYRLELGRELEARGFRIEIQDRSRMFFELKGVDPRLVEYFSSRRAEIEAQVAHWQEEGRFIGVPHGRLYEMAALETRDPKREITREDVVGIFEKGFEACGTSSLEVKRGLELSLEPRLEPGDGLTGQRALELAARDLTEQEAVISRDRLMDQAVRISGTRFGVGQLDMALEAGVQGVLRLGRDGRCREFYTTPAMRELEAGNLEKVRALAGTPFQGRVELWEVQAFRERLAPKGVWLTDGQWQELVNEVAGKSAFLLTIGDPGTVKTGTLGIIERFNEEVLRPEGREPSTINLAYTAKAAREMNSATGRPSFTIDGFLNQASKFDLQGQNSELAIEGAAGERTFISKEVPVVIRVDEAGFLGARQAKEIMEVVERLQERDFQVKLHLLGDTKQMQAIAAGDFLRQVEELGKRGEIEYAHLTEILRQRDPGLLEIARGLNREDRPLAENAREALAALDKRQELTVIASEPELRAAAVAHYLEQSRLPSRLPERAAAGATQSVLMVAATNPERKELNREVRAARIAAGEIEEGRSFKVLAPVHQGITADGYRAGDRVLFPGVRGEDGKLKCWGARIGTEAEVIGIDLEKNRVEVSYSFRTGKREGREIEHSVTRSFDAGQMHGKTALYREEERNFSVGDRIVALKNDKGLDLHNGDLGSIEELDRKGRALVDRGGRKVELDLARYRQLDHAYAVTIHKSQGSTVDHSIMVAVVRPEPTRGREPEAPGQYGHASYNALNVAVTRARFGTHVFTNSIEGLERSVQQVDAKTSTLKPCLPERSREAGLPLSSAGLGDKIRKLGQSVSLPREAPHRLSLEGIKVPPLPAAARAMFKSQPEFPAPQKSVGRELELSLPGRGFGRGR
jgi:conjugative relaxase-like TrwC/TraI family protein